MYDDKGSESNSSDRVKEKIRTKVVVVETVEMLASIIVIYKE